MRPFLSSLESNQNGAGLRTHGIFRDRFVWFQVTFSVYFLLSCFEWKDHPPAHQPATAWLQSIKWEKRSLLVLFKMTLRDGMGRGFRMGDTCMSMADSCNVWQKPLQYCKVISLQLK